MVQGNKAFLFVPVSDMDGQVCRELVGKEVILIGTAEDYERYEIMRQGYEEKLLAR